MVSEGLLWPGGVAGLAYLAYTLVPHAWLRSRSRAVRRSGPRERRAVAFTFDDGPDPDVTPKVAALLEQAGARGTFFVLAERLGRFGGVVRELVARGHEVGLHGLSHRHLWTLGPLGTWHHLREGVRRLQAATGHPVRYYRPPWGHFNGAVLSAARRLGLEVVLWTSAPPDWRRVGTDRLLAELTESLRPGAVIDLHDGGPLEARQALLEALPHVLHAARGMGLKAVTLSELFGEDGGVVG